MRPQFHSVITCSKLRVIKPNLLTLPFNLTTFKRSYDWVMWRLFQRHVHPRWNQFNRQQIDGYISGVTYEGTPAGSRYCDSMYSLNLTLLMNVGSIETLGSKHKIECYVATPTGEYDTSKVILYFPDAFGMQLINNQVRSLRDRGMELLTLIWHP